MLNATWNHWVWHSKAMLGGAEGPELEPLLDNWAAPADVDRLMRQLDGLALAGNTVVVVEHAMRVIAAGDWIIDVGPGAGEEGGHIVAEGMPADVARSKVSKTAPGRCCFWRTTQKYLTANIAVNDFAGA